jgi:hypothetical protein
MTGPSSPVSANLVMPEYTVRAGHSITGTSVVKNNTSNPIEVVGCGSIFQVLLVNASYHPNAVWPACAQQIIVPVGVSTYPVSIEARYNTCVGAPTAQGFRVCGEGGTLPPVPEGRYQATTFEAGTAIPVAQPVSITVTR